jgi:hypothetical protein
MTSTSKLSIMLGTHVNGGGTTPATPCDLPFDLPIKE